MDSFKFDDIARRFAGSRRTALSALALGGLAALRGFPDADARKKKKKKRKKKKKNKQCASRCSGQCCGSGTEAALLFPEDGEGCTCCPPERIWTSHVDVSRCCREGTRAIPGGGITTNGGPCCPAAQFCNGSCCNNGFTCVNGKCEQTECYSSQVQMACPGGTSKCCPPGWTCTLIKGASGTTCCPGKVCEGIYCCPVAG